MFQMNEITFAKIQKECCWFTLPIFEALPDIEPGQDTTGIFKDDVLTLRLIFAMTFGGFGYDINLTKAKLLATIRLGQLGKNEPTDKSKDDPEYLKWLGRFAQYNILLGTVFAYLHKYPVAAAFLMNGLKTRAVNLFMPYCDFIKYVLDKVSQMPAEPAPYEGCGFSADHPMGSIETEGGRLAVSAAEMIIPALEGDDNEIILYYRGGQSYGNLRRLGSVHGANNEQCIDVYEVLAVGSGFKLKKLKFYFNGYFSPENRFTVRLPKGFRLDPLSEAAKLFKVVEY